MSYGETLPGHGEHEHNEPPPPPYEEPGARKVVLRPLAGYKPQAVEWLWRERIPAGELTLLVGDGGLGKSTLLAHLAAEVTSGAATGLNGTRSVIVVLGEDDPARVLQARYRAAGADMSLVSVLALDGGMGDEPVSLPDELAMLSEEVALNRPDLLIVDPLGAHLNGSVDAHRDGGKGGVRSVLGPLSRIAQKYGTTIVCAVHLNKGSGPASSRIAGSAGFRNAARNVLVLAAHPDARQGGDDNGQRIIGHDKSNVGAVQASLEATVSDAPARDEHGNAMVRRDGQIATTSTIRIGDESDVDYEHALRAASDHGKNGDSDNALDDAVSFLRVELADGPLEVKELKRLAIDAGHAWRTVERAFPRAEVKSAKRGKTFVRYIAVGGLGGLDDSPESPAFTPLSGDGDSANTAKSANAATVGSLADLDAGSDGAGW